MFHRNQNNEITIIPIQGLYVSGTHYDPVYEDHNITITEMSSTMNSLQIVDYTEHSIDVYDPTGTVRFVDYDWNTTLTTVDYTSASTTHEDSTVRFVDTTWMTSMTIESYTSEDETQTDSGIRFISSYWTTDMTIVIPTPQPPDEANVPPDHYVSIIELSSDNNSLIIT